MSGTRSAIVIDSSDRFRCCVPSAFAVVYNTTSMYLNRCVPQYTASQLGYQNAMSMVATQTWHK